MHWMNIAFGFLLVSVGVVLYLNEGSESEIKAGTETFRGFLVMADDPVVFSPEAEALIIQFLAEEAEDALEAANEPIE